MTDTGKLERRDWLVAVGLFTVSLALRVPFRSQFAYHWDGAQFALAVMQYDPKLGFPHAPGFFLYVMAGKLVNFFVGDPHASLVWMSVVAGAVLPALGYFLARAMFGRSCGLGAGLILATSPLCWFHSEIALTTIVDSALVTATALTCWHAIKRDGGWPTIILMAVLLAIVAGTRSQSAPVLLPLWFYALLRRRRFKWSGVAVAVLLTGLLSLLWFLPLVRNFGGYAEYFEYLRNKSRRDAYLTPWVGGFNSGAYSLEMICRACWAGVLVAGLLAGVRVGQWFGLTDFPLRNRTYSRYSDQIVFLAVWILPMLVFGVAMYTFMPGYVLNYFPAIAIVCAGVLSRGGNVPRMGGGLSWVTVVLVNMLLFLSPISVTDGLLAGLRFTKREIHEHDRQLSAWFQAIRERYRPEDVIILHNNEWFFWGFRHFQYHLPEYENVMLSADPSMPAPLDQKIWCAKGRQIDFIERADFRWDKALVLVVPPGENLKMFHEQRWIARAESWDIPGSSGLYTVQNAKP